MIPAQDVVDLVLAISKQALDRLAVDRAAASSLGHLHRPDNAKAFDVGYRPDLSMMMPSLIVSP